MKWLGRLNWFDDRGHRCVECGRMCGTVVGSCQRGSRRLSTVHLERHECCRRLRHALIEQGPVMASRKLRNREARVDGVWQLFTIRWQLRCKRCGEFVYEERECEERFQGAAMANAKRRHQYVPVIYSKA